jgi:YfiH family protein
MIKKIQQKGLIFYQSTILHIPHALFTRHGGAGNRPYSSLNCSHGVGDESATVSMNRRRMEKALHIQSIKAVKQIHGDSILIIKSVNQAAEPAEYDAMMTNVPGIGLLIQQADCQAVLLHDPVKRVIAAIHNGWQGSVAGIIGKTIESMRRYFQTNPADIRAVVSPALGPSGAEFIHYQRELPPDFYPFKNANNYFDFRAISKRQLKQSGIMDKNIETAEICTACSNDFFSYRRARKKGYETTGRNGSIIALPVTTYDVQVHETV